MSWLALIEQHPLLLYGITGLFALMIGSFLNVVIHRLPKMMEHDWRQECASLMDEREAAPVEARLTLARPGSSCPHCGHLIRAHENIPVLSYLFLRGRCSCLR